MPLPILAESAIIVGAEADDWRAAVRVAGRALTASGATRPGYADEMIRMIEENGSASTSRTGEVRWPRPVTPSNCQGRPRPSTRSA